MKKGAWWTLALALLAAALVIYLRDPAWLIKVDSGFHAWEQDNDGPRFRWMGVRASFFVPSDATLVTIPLRAYFPSDDRRPFVVRVDLNDRPATQVVLTDDRWTNAQLRIVLPDKWSRKVARIDLHANRVWNQRELSVQVGEISVDK